MADTSVSEPRTCAQCGTPLAKGRPKRARYCSRQCQQAQRVTTAKERWRRVCEHCGEAFVSRRPGGRGYKGEVQEGRFCSIACFAAWRIAQRPEPEPMPSCEVCGEQCSRKGMKACSPECSRERARRISQRSYVPKRSPRKCQLCSGVFTPKHGNEMFCSKQCVSRHNRKKYGNGEARKRARRFGVAYEPVDIIAVFERDRWRCQICGCRTPKSWRGTLRQQAPELEHRVPMSMGGGHTWDNVQCACRRCNMIKGGTHIRGQTHLFAKVHRGGVHP